MALPEGTVPVGRSTIRHWVVPRVRPGATSSRISGGWNNHTSLESFRPCPATRSPVPLQAQRAGMRRRV